MDKSDRRARAGAEAAEWWVRIETGELSRGDREQFVDWLRESAVHVGEMLRMAEVHGALERFNEWTRVPTQGALSAPNVIPLASAAFGAERVPQSPVPMVRRRRLTVGLALAATLAVFGVFLSLMLSAQVIETGRAERRSVTLADGSVVQIDPESRLRIRLRKHERDIDLERGRALFRVAKDPNRPFLVQAEGTRVRAVGTQFGVEQDREGIVVTVAEGKVAVRVGDTAAVRAGGGNDGGRTFGQVNGVSVPADVLVSAGEQVVVPARGSAAPVRAVDTERELAWAAGRLVFENESVADVIDEFNRYNVVQLHVAKGALAQRAVTGVFDASEPESFIGFMQSVAPVNVRRAGQDITIALAP
ncbi:MAG: FecR domain-containing protein [Gammaproteobacteria bacterium]